MAQPLALLLTAAGVFAIVGAIADWDWFMDHRKARAMSRLIGRGGTRIVYILIGAFVAVIGVLLTFGIVD